MKLLRYMKESAQPFIYRGCAVFASKLEISLHCNEVNRKFKKKLKFLVF